MSDFEQEKHKLREDYSRKSALARQLVAEKDSTLKRITKEVDELREEVSAGIREHMLVFPLLGLCL